MAIWVRITRLVSEVETPACEGRDPFSLADSQLLSSGGLCEHGLRATLWSKVPVWRPRDPSSDLDLAESLAHTKETNAIDGLGTSHLTSPGLSSLLMRSEEGWTTFLIIWMTFDGARVKAHAPS